MNGAKGKTIIMAFGTFDFLHQGHLHFFKQARSLAKNPFLVVSVARGLNVKKIKGKSPLLSEKKRAQGVKNSGLVDKVVLGGKSNYLAHILKEKPAIIALGYDQSAYTKNLKQNLAAKGLQVSIKRLKSHKPHLYKSSILKKTAKLL
jgi:cytidyltransferase-like protein